MSGLNVEKRGQMSVNVVACQGPDSSVHQVTSHVRACLEML